MWKKTLMSINLFCISLQHYMSAARVINNPMSIILPKHFSIVTAQLNLTWVASDKVIGLTKYSHEKVAPTKLSIAAMKRSIAATFHHLNCNVTYQDTIEANQDNIGYNDQSYCHSPTLTQ